MTTRTFYAKDQIHSITIEPDGSWLLSRSGFVIDSYRARAGGKRKRTSERKMKQTADHIFEKKCIPYYHNLGE